MEIVKTAKKCNLMNIKEEFQIYYYSKQNKLIDEQKQIREANNKLNMFDLLLQFMNTPHLTS
jgi:hypothetical protein